MPEDQNGNKWIFIIEDVSTKWVELFALQRATAEECARVLINEIFLRFGLPRKIISDNGVQFISSLMQKVCFTLDIKETFTPLYHASANMVERKNRDLKPRLAILVGEDHTSWAEKLPTIRFAMNTAWCETTGQTAAYLTYGRELRTLDDVQHDLSCTIETENFVPQITPYLRKMSSTWRDVRSLHEFKQDRQKAYADLRNRQVPPFAIGDRVWVSTHTLSSAEKGVTSKFHPKRDGPYQIIRVVSPVSFEVANLTESTVPLGVYHMSALTPVQGTIEEAPVVTLRKRGRPRKVKKKPTKSHSGPS